MMRADEFSLSVTWMPRVNGVRAPVPGFYVRAAFANEGTAAGVVKNSWRLGVGGHGSPVPIGFMGDLIRLLGAYDLLVDGNNDDLLELAEHLEDGLKQARDAALKAKQAHLVQLRAEIAQLEQELSDADSR